MRYIAKQTCFVTGIYPPKLARSWFWHITYLVFVLQAQEDCSLTIELELLNLTGTRWASHACTLLPMLELFEQLKSHGTSQMTWHHLKCRLIWWPQAGTISARDSTSDAFNFCISRSGCGTYIATQWFWAALHLRSSAGVAEICCEPRTAFRSSACVAEICCEPRTAFFSLWCYHHVFFLSSFARTSHLDPKRTWGTFCSSHTFTIRYKCRLCSLKVKWRLAAWSAKSKVKPADVNKAVKTSGTETLSTEYPTCQWSRPEQRSIW